MDKSRLTDRQMEHLVQRSLFDDAAQVSARSGTFFAIQDRLGEQSGPGMRQRISDAFDSPIWRIIPMSKTQISTAAAVLAVVAVAIAYFAFLGSDDSEVEVAAEPTATQEPTATPVPPTPTPEPAVQVEATESVDPTATTASDPTATPAALPTPTEVPVAPTLEPTATRIPIPTATPAPTPVPLSLTSVDQVPNAPELVAFEAIPIPDTLKPDSERLGSSEVIDRWTEHLTGKRVVIGGSVIYAGALTNFGNTDHMFCDNGRGYYVGLPDFTPGEFVGQTFRWSVTHSPAAAWYSPILQTQSENSEVWIAINTTDAESGTPGALRARPLEVSDLEVNVDGDFNLTVHEPGDLLGACNSLPPTIE